VLVGRRLELAGWPPGQRIASQPLLVRVPGGGVAALFRCGVTVLFHVQPAEEQRFLASLKSVVRVPASSEETEELWLHVDPAVSECLMNQQVILQVADASRLQLVAEALCRSIVLAEYEGIVAEAFDRIEPLAAELRTRGATTWTPRRLLRQIGDALLSEYRMVARAEVTDKPELLWEYSQLEPLYARMIEELEIGERHRILERKLNLISRTATTSLELVQTRRGHRLEIYIVLLIVVEVVLILYDLFLR
jgi:uncharacterized Rmd1/YagE family protein